MPFSICLYHRFPIQCAVMYNAGRSRDKVRFRISRVLAGDSPVILPMRPGEPLVGSEEGGAVKWRNGR